MITRKTYFFLPGIKCLANKIFSALKKNIESKKSNQFKRRRINLRIKLRIISIKINFRIRRMRINFIIIIINFRIIRIRINLISIRIAN